MASTNQREESKHLAKGVEADESRGTHKHKKSLALRYNEGPTEADKQQEAFLTVFDCKIDQDTSQVMTIYAIRRLVLMLPKNDTTPYDA